MSMIDESTGTFPEELKIPPVVVEVDEEAKYEVCFYCFASMSKYNKENDHFPVPYDCGGVQTVPCCITCHDLKDRFPIDRWTLGVWSDLITEFGLLRSRTLRIFFAKVVCAAMRMEKIKKEGSLPKKV